MARERWFCSRAKKDQLISSKLHMLISSKLHTGSGGIYSFLCNNVNVWISCLLPPSLVGQFFTYIQILMVPSEASHRHKYTNYLSLCLARARYDHSFHYMHDAQSICQFKSTNFNFHTVRDQSAKLNSCQIFRLYGMYLILSMQAWDELSGKNHAAANSVKNFSWES